MHNRTNYHKEMPTGAIATKEELLDLVIEARKEKKAIRIWTVQQSGYLSCFYLYSKTKLYKAGVQHPNPIYGITIHADMLYPIYTDYSIIGYRTTNRRWFKGDEYPASYGVGNVRYLTEHRMFTNKKHAENYSNTLKNDRIYLEDVKRWHAECSRLFDNDFFNYDNYDD